MDVLAEFGPGAATTTDIAQRAGVARATLHRRFATKDALFHHALARELRAILANFAAVMLTSAEPADQIAEAFSLCIRTVRRPPFHHPSAAQRAELASAFTEGDPSLFERGRAFVAESISRQVAPAAHRPPRIKVA